MDVRFGWLEGEPVASAAVLTGLLTGVLTAIVVAQSTTSSSVPEIVGDPLNPWVVIGAGLAVLAFVLVAGTIVRRRITVRR